MPDAYGSRKKQVKGKNTIAFGILLSLGGFVVILLGQGVIGGVLIVLGIAVVAAALLFTAGRSKVQTGEIQSFPIWNRKWKNLRHRSA